MDFFALHTRRIDVAITSADPGSLQQRALK